MLTFFKLIDKKVVVCTLQAWADARGTDENRIAYTSVGGVSVSTVFLGVDLTWRIGKPQLFETMVFGGSLDRECKRYPTLEEAIEGHDERVKVVSLDLAFSKV